VIPDYSLREAKILVPLKDGIALLRRLFGPRNIIYANVALKRRGSKTSRLSGRMQRSIAGLPVQTRFAPSPTGGLHIGNARTGLIAYLCYLSASQNQRSRFYLRSDDTDSEKCSRLFTKLIEKQLLWLGIRWQTSFSQSQRHEEKAYLYMLDLLRETGAAYESPETENALVFGNADFAHGATFFDLALGSITFHERSLKRDGEEKLIPLARPNDGLPFYKFAGLIDDITFSTFVVRDITQERLTETQARIRQKIEESIVHLVPSAAAEVSQFLHGTFSENEDPILKMPIYIHVQLVVEQGNKLPEDQKTDKPVEIESTIQDDRISEPRSSKKKQNKLSKRNGREAYSLEQIQKSHVPAEAVLAYLLFTVSRSFAHISIFESTISFFAGRLARYGIDATLKELGSRFSPLKIAEYNKPVIYSASLLRSAEFVVLREWPEWRLSSFIRLNGPGGTTAKQVNFIWRERLMFASCNEIIRTLEGPKKAMSISTTTDAWLRALRSDGLTRPEQLITTLKLRLLALSDHPENKRMIYGDVRRALTGLDAGPPLMTVLNILTDNEVHRRMSFF